MSLELIPLVSHCDAEKGKQLLNIRKKIYVNDCFVEYCDA
jgi:hypothetical protein